MLNCRDALRCTQKHSAALSRTQMHSVFTHLRHEGATSVICGRQCPMNYGANYGEQEEQEGKGGDRVGHQRKVHHGPERIRTVRIEKAMVTVDARRDRAIGISMQSVCNQYAISLQSACTRMQSAGIT